MFGARCERFWSSRARARLGAVVGTLVVGALLSVTVSGAAYIGSASNTTNSVASGGLAGVNAPAGGVSASTQILTGVAGLGTATASSMCLIMNGTSELRCWGRQFTGELGRSFGATSAATSDGGAVWAT